MGEIKIDEQLFDVADKLHFSTPIRACRACRACRAYRPAAAATFENPGAVLNRRHL